MGIRFSNKMQFSKLNFDYLFVVSVLHDQYLGVEGRVHRICSTTFCT